jgi:DNA-binding NtrC family response regulator
MARTGILVVSSEPGHTNAVISAIGDDGSFAVSAVPSYRAALFALAKQSVSLIICDQLLQDGSWKDLLGRIAMMNEPPRLVVMAAPENRTLWAEAISLGAYDVLAKPMAAGEIRHVCSSAQRSQPVYEPVAG